jgi:hypothetical protein
MPEKKPPPSLSMNIYIGGIKTCRTLPINCSKTDSNQYSKTQKAHPPFVHIEAE